jgi:hypothetical protein
MPLPPEELELLRRASDEAEATLRLSGLHLGEFGQSIKARILSGEITTEQAQAEIHAHFCNRDK